MNTNPQCIICPSLHNSIFKYAEPKSFAVLDQNKKTKLYKKGQIIFYEGHPANYFYCINSGKIIVYKSSHDGKRHITRIAAKGEPLGHLAIFSDQLYSATAEVLEDTQLCIFDRKFIFPVLSQNQDITWDIVRKLSNELILAQKKAVTMANLTVRERVANLLLLLKEKYGVKQDNGFTLEINLSREDLADLAGTSKETLVRTLSDFKNENIILTKKSQIIIQSPMKLAHIIGYID